MTEQEVRDKLKTVYDPEIGINVVDLGLIYDIRLTDVEGGQKADIDMTLTAMGCPLAGMLQEEVRQAAIDAGAIESVVNIVFEPAWTPDRLSDDVKDMLGLL
jgi:metal-sulfur cluster biosynthetic enzyme